MKTIILKIRAFFGSLALDKVEHVFLSFVCCIVLGGIFHLWGISHDTAIYLSLGITLALGLAKEVFDKISKLGQFAWDDFGADFIGTCLGLLYLALFVV